MILVFVSVMHNLCDICENWSDIRDIRCDIFDKWCDQFVNIVINEFFVSILS